MIETLNLDIETFESTTAGNDNKKVEQTTMLEILKEQVCNSSELNKSRSKQNISTEVETPIEYLIVTKNYLRNTSQELATWKKQKGVNSEIITVEDIASKYNGKDIQEKIKKAIYEYYTKGLKYVLLGGDDKVVPVRYCYCKMFSDLSELQFV